jgi:hypothetical protein
MKIKKAWISSAATSDLLSTICLRFDKAEWDRMERLIFSPPVVLQIDEFPDRETRQIEEKHVRIGLIDTDSLIILRDAINEYLFDREE